jgi:hypothetical protein
MATKNKTREGTRNRKKQIEVAASVLDGADEFAAVGDVSELQEIAEDALIIEATCFVKSAFITSAVITLKLDGVAIRVFNVGTSTGNIAGVALTAKLDSGIGGKLTATLSGSATVGTGVAVILVDYVEYNKNTGELTPYSTT